VIAMDRTRLFVASCVSLVTTSMVFAIRGDVAGPMSSAFQITNEQMGLIFSPAFWAFTIAIFISGALVDLVGMRALHVLSAIGYFVGIGLVLVAPHPDAPVASIFDHAGTALVPQCELARDCRVLIDQGFDLKWPKDEVILRQFVDNQLAITGEIRSGSDPGDHVVAVARCDGSH